MRAERKGNIKKKNTGNNEAKAKIHEGKSDIGKEKIQIMESFFYFKKPIYIYEVFFRGYFRLFKQGT